MIAATAANAARAAHRLLAVRLALGILLLLIGMGLALCQWEGRAAPLPEVRGEASWVRTAQGWERQEAWLAETSSPPRLHPLVVAAGQTLLSMLALAAFGSSLRRSRQRLWAMLWTGR